MANSGWHPWCKLGDICKVSWITEWCQGHRFLSLYWFPKVSAWRDLNGAWWIQSGGQKEVIHVLWSMSTWLLCMLLQRQKLVLFCNWLLSCTHVLVVLCEAAIVLQSKSINLFRDAATGPILSLTTNHVCLSCALDFDFGICIQWSRCRNCFWLCLLLLLTLCPCRLPFHTQVMIPTRPCYRLASLAVASVDGCCLYIIIHNSMSCRAWL